MIRAGFVVKKTTLGSPFDDTLKIKGGLCFEEAAKEGIDSHTEGHLYFFLYNNDHFDPEQVSLETVQVKSISLWEYT